MDLEIRKYQSSDFDACRSLWGELTVHHREIYDDPTIGGVDPGKVFESYLDNPERRASWVAVTGGKVIGLTGLIGHGETAEVEPLVVTASHRSQGIGKRLVQHLVQEARAIGVRFLSAKPVARNVDGLTFFVAVGFDIVGHLDLFQDLSESSDTKWVKGIELHGKKLRY